MMHRNALVRPDGILAFILYVVCSSLCKAQTVSSVAAMLDELAVTLTCIYMHLHGIYMHLHVCTCICMTSTWHLHGIYMASTWHPHAFICIYMASTWHLHAPTHAATLLVCLVYGSTIVAVMLPSHILSY